MNSCDKLIWIKIIESLNSEIDQKKVFYRLLQLNKKIYNTLRTGVYQYFKNKWRRWFTQGQDSNYYYVFQGLSIDFLDGIFLMFKFNCSSPILTGQFIDDFEVGEWRRYFDNGKISNIDRYSNGLKVGEQIEYSIIGRTIGIYNYNSKGELHGDYYCYSDESEMYDQYVNGARNGKKTLIKNGIVIFECDYLNGKENGHSLEKWENGNIKREMYWENGKRHGAYEEFHNNGKIFMKGQYCRDLPVGEHKMWWENGNLASIVNYNENGEVNGMVSEYNLKGDVKKKYIVQA